MDSNSFEVDFSALDSGKMALTSNGASLVSLVEVPDSCVIITVEGRNSP
jgi:hypothetical protein